MLRFTALVILLVLQDTVFGQKQIKPLFPPRNIKPFPPVGPHRKPLRPDAVNFPIDEGVFPGDGGVLGRVTYSEVGPMPGRGALLGGPEFPAEPMGFPQPTQRITKRTQTTYFPDDGATIDGGIGGPSGRPLPRPEPRPRPYPVPFPVPQPNPEPRTETIRVPYPVRIPVPIRVPQPVTVRVPQPVQIRVPQPYPVKVPQPYPVPMHSNSHSSGAQVNGGIAGGVMYNDDFDRCMGMYSSRDCYDHFGYGQGMIGGHRRQHRGMGGIFRWLMAREIADNMDFGFPDYGDFGYPWMLGYGRNFGRYGGRFGAMGGGMGYGRGFGYGGFGIAGRYGFGGIGGRHMRRHGKGGRGGNGGENEGGNGGKGGSNSGGHYWDFSSDNDD